MNCYKAYQFYIKWFPQSPRQARKIFFNQTDNWCELYFIFKSSSVQMTFRRNIDVIHVGEKYPQFNTSFEVKRLFTGAISYQVNSNCMRYKFKETSCPWRVEFLVSSWKNKDISTIHKSTYPFTFAMHCFLLRVKVRNIKENTNVLHIKEYYMSDSSSYNINNLLDYSISSFHSCYSIPDKYFHRKVSLIK